MPVDRHGGAFAAAAGRFGAIQMRHHFSRSALAGDPAEVMLAGFFAEAGVGGEGGQAIGGDSARNRVRAGIIAVAGGQSLAPMPHAIGELHAIAAAIAETPMAAVALDLEAGGCLL